LTEDTLNSVQTVYQHKDGTLLDIHLSTAQVKDIDGKILGIVRIMEDLGDRQRKEFLGDNRLSTGKSLSNVVAIAQSESGVNAFGQMLLNQYASGKRDFLGWNLCGVNFVDVDLENSNLNGAQLNGSDLKNANLQRASLRGANLRGANLQNANLRWTDLSGADLRGANLHEADLRDVSLIGVSFDRHTLAGAILSTENPDQAIEDDSE
jgi:uncharacterized protein YjbI with pentapeptide repeats